ncbi:MAG: prepilin-type N-terminal cleavage/methylation domain-containing protein [Propionibacteriales bacterium]|nr:prepilin-type N-terminal cleavage/methylation domain-containing protein [Propionibacteriales bacterium]
MPDILRRRTDRNDSGVTLVELLISMSIFSLVLAITYAVLITVQRQTRDATGRADAVGDARLSLEHIDRQVRSGNVLYDPASETLPLSMRVYTQANGSQRCVQWQVYNGVLRTRSWSPTWQTDGEVSEWAVAARNVVNTSATPPFTLQGGSTAYGSRLIDVTLRVKAPNTGGSAIDVTSSLSGRNTAYGYDPGICSPMPAA